MVTMTTMTDHWNSEATKIEMVTDRGERVMFTVDTASD